MWINHYNIGDSNEMHNHITANGPVYVAIVILDTGTDEELVIYDGSTPVVHTPTAGEVYLLPGEVMHGLNAVKDRLTAFMIMYSINQ